MDAHLRSKCLALTWFVGDDLLIALPSIANVEPSEVEPTEVGPNARVRGTELIVYDVIAELLSELRREPLR